jgi:FKBP-type peptidyl-prolyl cis-trans isomerase
MAYGNRQVGDLIPPGSTLVFEVELVDLKSLDL